MASTNGESSQQHAPLELQEVLHIETSDGESLQFEVVGILEDPDSGTSYAVLLHEPEGEEEEQFIVTDLAGNLVNDDELAQEVLDEFLTYACEAEESAVDEGTN
ncbi:MAG TPA: hypothetical protein VGX91_15395 [Candidatus Cybelea sp.]|jgi:hypothetical protein|nr:hypothetical protein [Candidatus Cybelea sp.]